MVRDVLKLLISSMGFQGKKKRCPSEIFDFFVRDSLDALMMNQGESFEIARRKRACYIFYF